MAMSKVHKDLMARIRWNLGYRGCLRTPIMEFRLWLTMRREERYRKTGKRPYSALRHSLELEMEQKAITRAEAAVLAKNLVDSLLRDVPGMSTKD